MICQGKYSNEAGIQTQLGSSSLQISKKGPRITIMVELQTQW